MSAPPAPSPLVPTPGQALQHELARKALHLSSAAVPVGYALGVPRRVILPVLVTLLVIAIAVEIGRRVSTRGRGSFTRLLGPLLREHEHRQLVGATWMLAAYTAAVWLTPAPVAIAATWAVAAGDASAAIVGRTLAARRATGTPRPPAAKSWSGSATCALVSAAGAFALAGLPPLLAIATGLIAAAAERPAAPLDDNLRIVLAVSGLLMLTGVVSP